MVKLAILVDSTNSVTDLQKVVRYYQTFLGWKKAANDHLYTTGDPRVAVPGVYKIVGMQDAVILIVNCSSEDGGIAVCRNLAREILSRQGLEQDLTLLIVNLHGDEPRMIPIVERRGN